MMRRMAFGKLLIWGILAWLASCRGEKVDIRRQGSGAQSHPQEGDGTPQPSPPSPPTPAVNDTELQAQKSAVLGYLHSYLINQTVTGAYNPSLTALATYKVPVTNDFYKSADTYDNAIASIFFSASGKGDNAKTILDSYLRIMTWRGYKAALASSAERIAKLQLLPARFSFAHEKYLRISAKPDDSWEQDTGNNSFLGLAFCKFYNKYHSQMEDGGTIYWNAGFDLLNAIHSTRRCPSGSGYWGRDGVSEGKTWVSVEHNTDMYALAKCLAVGASTPEAKTIVADAANVSGKFVADMYDPTTKLYGSGADKCGGTRNEAFVPVDTQTWRYLADAELSEPTVRAQRTADSVGSILSDTFFTMDAPELANGCEVSPPAGVVNVIACNTVDTAKLFYGVKFSNKGLGVHLENTGAAYLAAAHYVTAGDASQKIDRSKLEKMRTSLVAHINKVQSGGLPANFREASLVAGNSTYYNTGITWDYFRFPHTAANAWAGLALGYQFHPQDMPDPGFNPYSPESSKVAYQGAKLESLKTSDLQVVDCPAGLVMPGVNAEAQGCKVAADDIGSYCMAFCPNGKNEPTYFRDSMNQDQHMLLLGLTKAATCDICGHPRLLSCTPTQFKDFLKYLWLSYANGCS